jgi:predicted nucleic acid-binding Zn ribbon protein
MKDDALKVCPKDKCRMKKWGKGKIRRLLGTGAGLIFKGSGFYITDYRSEGYKQAAKKDSGEAPKADTKSDTKTESKTKTEPKPKKEAKPSKAE